LLLTPLKRVEIFILKFKHRAILASALTLYSLMLNMIACIVALYLHLCKSAAAILTLGNSTTRRSQPREQLRTRIAIALWGSKLSPTCQIELAQNLSSSLSKPRTIRTKSLRDLARHPDADQLARVRGRSRSR
jgi:hypothetical protein